MKLTMSLLHSELLRYCKTFEQCVPNLSLSLWEENNFLVSLLSFAWLYKSSLFVFLQGWQTVKTWVMSSLVTAQYFGDSLD